MGPILPDEELSRYLFESGKFAATKGRVKPGAFVPAKNGKTSVFRTFGMLEAQNWELGETVAREVQRTLLARAEVHASKVPAPLRIEPSEPPPRHANLIAWPESRDEQLMLALQIAEEARLFLKPTRNVETPR